MSFKGKDIISIRDFSKEEIDFILLEAYKRKMNFHTKLDSSMLEGHTMISAFFEDSTRTRMSFDDAMKNLGGTSKGFAGPAGTSLNKGESTYHTLKMLEGYGGHVIVMRHPLEGMPRYMAEKFNIPVINGGDGAHEHPTQTFLDLFTIKETQGVLEDLTISLVGDLKGGRTTHSLALALSLFRNIKLYMVSPQALSMPSQILDVLKKRNVEIVTTDNLDEAVKKSDIVYMTRLQKERLPDDLKPLYDKMKIMFQLDSKNLASVKPNLRILHPLPISKEAQEIKPNVDDCPYSYYFQQAQNGLYVRMALLGLVLGGIPSPDFKHPAEKSEPTNFAEVDIAQKPAQDKRVGDISDGLFIDHLPAGSAMHVVKMMGYGELPYVFTGMNVRSGKYGSKDMIKIESSDFDLSDLDQLNKLALTCPNATINLIKGGKIVRKGQVILPSELSDIVRCPNERCVTNPEHRETEHTRFRVVNRKPLVMECCYCDHVVTNGNLYVINK